MFGFSKSRIGLKLWKYGFGIAPRMGCRGIASTESSESTEHSLCDPSGPPPVSPGTVCALGRIFSGTPRINARNRIDLFATLSLVCASELMIHQCRFLNSYRNGCAMVV